MSIAQAFLAEFEQEAGLTRKFLERLPDDKLGWKPHPKSMSAGQLALHLALVPSSVLGLTESNPATLPNFANGAPQPASVDEVLTAFESTVSAVKSKLPGMDDGAFHELWRVQDGERELFAMPRVAFLRSVMLNHWYQHRGQMSVYLRMLDINVPSTYGPSADEPPDFLQKPATA